MTSVAIELTTSVPPATTSQPAAERVQLLDGLRLFAIFDIILWHIAGHHVVGFGLPCFLVMLAALAGRRERPGDLRRLMTSKLRLFFEIWVFWCAVYLIANASADLARGHGVLDRYAWPSWFYGPAIHLWFMPWAAAALLATNLLQRALRPLAPVARCLLLAGLGVAAVGAAVWLMSVIEPVTPFAQWIFALPAVPFGLAIGQAYAQPPGKVRLLLLFLIAAVVAVAFPFLQPLEGAPAIATRYTMVAVVLCLAFTWSGPQRAWFENAAKAALGIYLIHPLFLAVGRLVPGFESLHLVAAGAFVMLASFAAAHVLKRTPLKRFVWI